MEMKTNEHQSKGQCDICKKVNHTSIWKTFVQDGWFRGDDIYVGKFCKICKAHRKSDIQDFIKSKLAHTD